MKHRYIISYFLILCITLFFITCKKEKNEFAKQQIANTEDSIAFLGEGKEAETETETETDVNNTINSAAVDFGKEYKDIKKWGQIEFAQKEKKITESNNENLNNFLKQSRFGKRQETFFPIDTQIGALQAAKKNNYIDKKIYEITNNFFDQMKRVALDKEISNFVLSSEIPIISRQIARSAQYGPEIVEVRIGKIQIENNDSRSARVRVIRKSKDIEARATFQFYFVNVQNTWLINAIEGDFNALQVSYQHPGQFVPLGTTGITQGF